MRGGHVKLTKEEMDKLCAWIDLCIPYSGHYTEGMKPTDSAAYIARFNKTRGAHQIVEKANIESFINDGQYQVSVYKPGKKNPGDYSVSDEDLFRIRFSANSRTLSVDVPCAGTLVLMDLSGRRIIAYAFSREMANTGMGNSFRLSLPRGLYIAKFTGARKSIQRTISML
jgi:hypothetical protein